MTTNEPDARGVPLLSVVRGEPTPEQLAALIAVVTARAADSVDEPIATPQRPLWATPVLRAPLFHGPGAWCASGLPR